jgi:hypothetical protein
MIDKENEMGYNSNMTKQLTVLKHTYTNKNLGRCYNRENHTILIEGTHPKEVIESYGENYVQTHQRGQMNSFDGFKVRDDGNTEVYISHTIDSGD